MQNQKDEKLVTQQQCGKQALCENLPAKEFKNKLFHKEFQRSILAEVIGTPFGFENRRTDVFKVTIQRRQNL